MTRNGMKNLLQTFKLINNNTRELIKIIFFEIIIFLKYDIQCMLDYKTDKNVCINESFVTFKKKLCFNSTYFQRNISMALSSLSFVQKTTSSKIKIK